MLEKRGFTLIELLVVVGLIGILIGIVMTGAAGARRNARIQQANAEVRGIVTAVRAYKVEFGRWPVREYGGTWGGNNNNADLIRELTKVGNGRINFLEVSDPNKSFCDPFGTNTAYRINIDVSNDRVGASSLGPDGKPSSGDEIGFSES
jgi:general secretion pathway protein G